MKHKGKRMLAACMSFVLTATFVGGQLPPGIGQGLLHAQAGDSGEDLSEMNALGAIGIDTSAAPEGFDPNDSVSNPYGKGSMTMNTVREPLVIAGDEAWLYGENSSADTLQGLTGSRKTAQAKLNQEIWASDITAANFNGNTQGKEAQYAMVYLSGKDNSGATGDSFKTAPDKLYLGIRNADGSASEYGADLELMGSFETFGSASDRISYNTGDVPCMMRSTAKNYLQVAAGDFDGNGVDEIAVYCPDQNKPEIRVYQYLPKTGAGKSGYLNADSNWSLVWSYSLPVSEFPYSCEGNSGALSMIPNMVSMTAGDINQDGIEDLIFTYGSVAERRASTGSTAVVLYGSGSGMLQSRAEWALNAESGSQVLRAGVSFGEVAGNKVLIVGGQLLEDMNKYNYNTRYAALYQYDPEQDTYSVLTEQNVDLFEKSGDAYVNKALAEAHLDKDGVECFYSLPNQAANVAVLARGLSENPMLYVDSLLLEYQESGLKLSTTLDISSVYQPDTANPRYYNEFDVEAGDCIGSGYAACHGLAIRECSDFYLNYVGYTGSRLTLFDMIGNGAYRSEVDTDSVRYVLAGNMYKNLENGAKLDAIVAQAANYRHALFGYEPGESGSSLQAQTFAGKTGASGAMLNTDDDTTYIQYTGNHYFTYSDPQVLAVISSPPYFRDLLNRDDLSGNYAESGTAYGSTKGSGAGATASASISAGVYVSIDEEVQILGVTVAQTESEVALSASFTYEYEKMSSLEQSVEYATSAGADAVVLYSVPCIVYEYTVFSPNGDGTYSENVMALNFPKTASIVTMDLERYETIAADFEELPSIAGNVVTHTVGEPATYPASPEGFRKAIVYDGDYMAVGYTDLGGGMTQSQSIDMTEEESHSFSGEAELEMSAGGGMGGIIVGCKGSISGGGGYVMTSTSGSSFTATMQNMPAEAEEYGYYMAWKLFAYEYAYDDNGTEKTFPVVSYLVTDVEQPPLLPEDLELDSQQTREDAIALTWSYDRLIAGFQLYQHYDFPDGAGTYELAYVPFSQGVKGADGKYHFTYLDENLAPYTDYTYQIQAVRSSVPNNSIPCEELTVKTKTASGYPELSLSGVEDDGTLSLYPDSRSTVSVQIGNSGDYPQGASYQWQKLTEDGWTNLKGKTGQSYTFSSSGYSTAGSYRCRVNVIWYDQQQGNTYYISSYTQPFEAIYRVRKVKLSADIITSDSSGIPDAQVSFEPVNQDYNAAPTGTVTFTITGADYSKAYTVGLNYNGSVAAASLADFDSIGAAKRTPLDKGVYTLSVRYSGSRIFASAELGEAVLLVGDEGYSVLLYDAATGKRTNTLVYGNGGHYDIVKYTHQADGTVAEQVISAKNAFTGMNAAGEQVDSAALDCGSYTLTVSDGQQMHDIPYSITKRKATIGVAGTLTGSYGDVTGNLPRPTVLAGDLPSGYDQGLCLTAFDSSGRQVTLDDTSLPGSYRLLPAPTAQWQAAFAKNLDVTYVPAEYIVTGQKYPVSVTVHKLNGMTAGTVTMTQPDHYSQAQLTGETPLKFSSGTPLYLTAAGYSGYEPAYWTVKHGTVTDTYYGNTLAYTMLAEPVEIQVYFKTTNYTLRLMESRGGTVIPPSDFTNGSIVRPGTEYLFIASANPGYSFARWELVVGGRITTYPDAMSTITMPSGSAYLYPVFIRDSYTVTFGAHLRAYYLKENEDDPQGTPVKKYITSGTMVPGDTEVTVEPEPGYSLEPGAEWTVNGSAVSADDSCTFTLTQNTEIHAAVTQGTYSLRAWAGTGGTISCICGSDSFTDVPELELAAVSGSQSVVLTASPAYRYVFSHWLVNGEHAGSDATLVIPGMYADSSIEAVFADNAVYTITPEFAAPNLLDYRVTDPDGMLRASGSCSSGTAISAYKGDSVTFTAQAAEHYAIDKWFINGVVLDTTAKTYTIDSLQSDMQIQVDFAPTNYVILTYGSNDSSQGTISRAYAAGTAIGSGASLLSGTDVTLYAVPDTSCDLEKWLVNGKPVYQENGGTLYDAYDLTLEDLTESTTVQACFVPVQEPEQVNGAYEIYNRSQLYWYAEHMRNNDGDNARLMADITVNRQVLDENGLPRLDEACYRVWHPLGVRSNVAPTEDGYGSVAYRGNLEGNGHSISGLYFSDARCQYTGFIGRTEGGVITNLGIEDSYFLGMAAADEDSDITSYIGGIAAYITGSTIRGCYSTATLGNCGSYAGGIVGGKGSYTTVEYCYAAGRILNPNGGGIVGRDYTIFASSRAKTQHCFYLDTTASADYSTSENSTDVAKLTRAQFASGEAACRVNNSGLFRQILGVDPLPSFRGCPVVQEDGSYKNQHSFENGKCSICGYWEDGVGEALEGCSLSLNENIGVHFYMELSDAVIRDAGAIMQLTLPDGTVQTMPVSACRAVNSSYYVFSCSVNAKEMTDTIQAQIILGDGTRGTLYSYSVRSYADYILTHQDAYSEQTVALVQAMLHYGAAAQNCFAYNTEDLADAGVEPDVSGITPDGRYDLQCIGTAPEGLEFTGISLVLRQQTALRFYFRVQEGYDISQYTFQLSGRQAQVQEKNGWYYIEISDLSAEALSRSYGVTLPGSEGYFVVAASALSYANAVLADPDASGSMQAMAKALYLYSQAAAAYANS